MSDPCRMCLCTVAALLVAVSGCGGGESEVLPVAGSRVDVGAPAAHSGDTAPLAEPPSVGFGPVPAGAVNGLPENGRVIHATPSNYLELIRALQPGDTLMLEPGDYDKVGDVPGLPLFNLNGTQDKPILITGPDTGPRPRLLGRATHNTVRLAGSSYVVVRNLEINGRDAGGAGQRGQTFR